MNYNVCSIWDWISDAKCTALDSLKMDLISGVWGCWNLSCAIPNVVCTVCSTVPFYNILSPYLGRDYSIAEASACQVEHYAKQSELPGK
jgi:hypothetical protein